MRKPSFENLHPNHKMAFLDGLLTGIALAYYGKKIWEQIQEDRRFAAELKEAQRKTQDTTK